MKRLYFLVLGVLLYLPAHAQDGESPVSYKSLGMQFSTRNINGNAASLVLPSYSMFNGYGSYVDNPAVMAMASENEMSLGLYYGNNKQEASFLGNTGTETFGNVDFGDFGMIFKYPTSRGSFVIGAGYNLVSAEKYKSFLSGRNTESTITDVFKDPGSGYSNIAFEAFAIDYADMNQDSYESIFRIGFTPNQYPGITQYADILREQTVGEYSAFAAIELQKNLYGGVSIGVVKGRASYNRKFQEYDEFNDYDGNFIGADAGGAGGTDIDQIVSRDKLNSDITGFSLAGGLAYNFGNFLTVGASVQLPSKMTIRESYSSGIQSYFDDGSNTDEHEFYGDFRYAVTRPMQIGIGATAWISSNFALSFATERIDYRKINISLTESNISDPVEKAELRQTAQQINSEISSDYKEVKNVKAGAMYEFSSGIALKAGYSIFPAKSSVFSKRQKITSAGLSIPLSEAIFFDLSAQYSTWNDRSILYTYKDPVSDDLRVTETGKKLELFNMVAGIRIRF